MSAVTRAGFVERCGRRPCGRQQGQAEVHDLDLAVGRHEDVARLDVPVHDAFGVRRLEAGCDLQRQIDHIGGRHRLAVNTAIQRFALEQLHHQITDGCGIRDLGFGTRKRRVSEVVDGADVRVTQGSDGARLAIEALAKPRVRGQMRRQNLNRDAAVEAGVVRAIHLAHPAGSQESLQFVPAEACAGRHRHLGSKSPDYRHLAPCQVNNCPGACRHVCLMAYELNERRPPSWSAYPPSGRGSAKGWAL